jgi:hypothetical protein
MVWGHSSSENGTLPNLKSGCILSSDCATSKRLPFFIGSRVLGVELLISYKLEVERSDIAEKKKARTVVGMSFPGA